MSILWVALVLVHFGKDPHMTLVLPYPSYSCDFSSHYQYYSLLLDSIWIREGIRNHSLGWGLLYSLESLFFFFGPIFIYRKHSFIANKILNFLLYDQTHHLRYICDIHSMNFTHCLCRIIYFFPNK